MKYRISYEVQHVFYVEADDIEQAARMANTQADAEYPGIAYRIEMDDEEGE